MPPTEHGRKVVYLHSTDGTARLWNPAPQFFSQWTSGHVFFSVTSLNSYYGSICFLSSLAVVDPEGPGTPVATVRGVRKEVSKWGCWGVLPVLAQNIEEGQNRDCRSHTSVLCRCLPCPCQRGGALRLQEDATACVPEFSVWPPSPVTHTRSVQNLCLKTLDVKKGRAEADCTTEIGLWRWRRSGPFFCTKLSARDPKNMGGREEKTWPDHQVLCPPSIDTSASS